MSETVCCHIIRVTALTGVYSVKEVPDQYILRRWTWNADEVHGQHDTQELNIAQQGLPAKLIHLVRNMVMKRNFTSTTIDEACNYDEMRRPVDKHRKEMRREMEVITNRKLEKALHMFPRSTSVAATGTFPLTENSDMGSGASTTHIKNPPPSNTKGRPKKIRYKSDLDVQATRQEGQEEAERTQLQ